jgi:hypothetical protein
MTYKELTDLPTGEIVKKIDSELGRSGAALHRGNAVETAQLYLYEPASRDQRAQTKTMLKLTVWITAMTAVVTIATIVQVILAFKAKK